MAFYKNSLGEWPTPSPSEQDDHRCASPCSAHVRTTGLRLNVTSKNYFTGINTHKDEFSSLGTTLGNSRIIVVRARWLVQRVLLQNGDCVAFRDGAAVVENRYSESPKQIIIAEL